MNKKRCVILSLKTIQKIKTEDNDFTHREIKCAVISLK
jgi:hypothetical protein